MDHVEDIRVTPKMRIPNQFVLDLVNIESILDYQISPTSGFQFGLQIGVELDPPKPLESVWHVNKFDLRVYVDSKFGWVLTIANRIERIA